jgi:oligopeptide transport system substrate-binding protein
MKRLLSLLLTIALAASSLVGCAGDNKSKTVDKYMTTYVTEAQTLNPYLLLDSTALSVTANTQDGLVENDKFGRYVPALAENWKSNEDFTVWTLNIRKGVKWVDSLGKETQYEVKASDFVEGMRYVADPKNGIKNVGIIRKEIKGLNDYYYDLSDIDTGKLKTMTREQALANFDKNVGIKAIDEYTLQYTTAKPTPYFLSYLVTELFFPVQKEFLASVGASDYGTSKEKLLYTGAYVLSGWQRDKSITLTKNDFYWDKENVFVKSINFQKVADDAVGTQMFQRGEISQTTLKADQVTALKGTKWEELINLREKSSVTYWFFMNYASQNSEFTAFINNDNFRKALYSALDRTKLQSLFTPYNPEVMLRNTIIPEDVLRDEKGIDYTDFNGLKEIKAKNTFNAAEAKTYMEKAIKELVNGDGTIKGVTPKTVDMLPIAKFNMDGKLPLQLVYVHGTDSTDTKMAQLLKAMLEENLGKENLEVVLGQYVDDKFNDSIGPKKFDMSYDSFSFKYADPMAQLGRLVSDGSINDGELKDATFDTLVANASAITDINKRYEAFAAAESYMINKGYVIPWVSGGGAYVLTKVIPFTTPKGGFGVTRFKLKGMLVSDKAVTTAQWKEYESKFNVDMKNSFEGK